MALGSPDEAERDRGRWTSRTCLRSQLYNPSSQLVFSQFKIQIATKDDE
jgi:hypothetical protein